MRPKVIWTAVAALLMAPAAFAAPEPAIPALFRLADQYPALGESHWSQAKGRFYQSLVRTSGFADHFNTIVLECGGSRYQATLDRHMNAEDVSYGEVSHVWRDTTKAVG